MPVTSWSTVAGNNNGAPPNGAPEGQAPSTVNNVIRQIMADVARESQINDVKVLKSVAGTNTITADMDPELASYSAGMMIVITPANNCTGATTLNIDGLGALDVLKLDGDALISGDLVAGIPALLVLDSGADDWILMNPQAAITPSTSLIEGSEPRLRINESDVGSDLKNWDIVATASTLIVRTRTDADGAGKEAIKITRGTTTAISRIDIGNATDNPDIYLNGGRVLVSGGSFTASLSGFTGAVTETIYYAISGGICTLTIVSDATGTSNTTDLTMTFLAADCADILPQSFCVIPCSGIIDNSNILDGSVHLDTDLSDNMILTFRLHNTSSVANRVAPDASAFTNSGSKGLRIGWTITYPIT